MRIAPIFIAATLCSTPALAGIFKDWEIGCDNTKSCRAIAMAAEDGAEATGYMLIERSGAANAEPVVSFWMSLSDQQSTKAANIAETRFTLKIDKKPVEGQPQISFIKSGVDDSWFKAELSARQGRQLVASVKKGSNLTIEDSATKAPVIDVSLNGSVAALLYMDDKQNRVGTVTALIRPGDQPASAIPAPPAAPVVRIVTPPPGAKADTSYVEAIWNRLKNDPKNECIQSDPDQADAEKPSGDADVLDEKHMLISINCPMGGAYNSDTVFFIVKNGDVANAREALFQSYDEKTGGLGAPQAMPLTNARFDAKTGTLSYFGKARGLGDCGDMGTYGWTGEAFQLISEASMSQCRSVLWDQWPRYWRAETTGGK